MAGGAQKDSPSKKTANMSGDRRTDKYEENEVSKLCREAACHVEASP